jgi:hypothetical protein
MKVFPKSDLKKYVMLGELSLGSSILAVRAITNRNFRTDVRLHDIYVILPAAHVSDLKARALRNHALLRSGLREQWKRNMRATRCWVSKSV